MTNMFNEEVGLLKRASIIGYNPDKETVQIRLANQLASKGRTSVPIEIPSPHSMFYNNGLYIGSNPVPGTPIIVSQGSGGEYFFVSNVVEALDLLPERKDNELLIHANSITKITLDKSSSEIKIGSDENNIHISSDSSIITTTLDSNNSFTQASRSVNGVVKRDLRPNENFAQSLKLTSDFYDSFLYPIGLDPSVTANSITSGSSKNPTFVEKREMVYEFQHNSDVVDDYNESLLYNDNSPPQEIFQFPNRRQSRSDTLSLTLLAPNFLMESIKGTVVDIFGNILDINRFPIPIGIDQNSISIDNGLSKVESFIKIKELERKSIAFHYELNARKDFVKVDQIVFPDINSNADYSRDRSRLSVDVDKEGQFKINIPASSEKGNISLLTRYENYSSFGDEDNNNPNKLIFREDNLDIFQDSFAAPRFNITDGSFSTERGSISIMDGDKVSTPIDRITNAHIKHGTTYHDVLATCYTHQIFDFLDWQAEAYVDVKSIPLLKNVATDTIVIGGDTANAGGRSGQINLDGSIEVSIGANTIDRQSLWLDTAGGIVANVGRDINNKSAVVQMNGDLVVQVGGLGVDGDSRFIELNNKHYGGVIDIRVINSGLRVTMIRIDDEGVKIMTPSNLQIHSGQSMKISSDADIEIECENLILQKRLVLKELEGSI